MACSRPEKIGIGHNVFLSHSGENKDFVGILAEELQMRCYRPFFDRESLQRAEKVNMNGILKVAEKCKLGLIVVSDHFFCKTKNPMLELSTFVERGVPLLPLFYKLSVDDVKDKKKRVEWEEIWRQWSVDDNRIDISKWIRAVDELIHTTGLECDRPARDPVQYARIVADEVCRILVPDIPLRDEHVQGKERLCQEVKCMFAKAPNFRGAKVLALYGIEGVGKSALCLALRNFYHAEFGGRVCYVVPRDRHNGGDQSCLQVEDIWTISYKLANLEPRFAETHITDVDKGIAYLDTHLSESKKFLLILDNIHGYSQDEVRKLILDRASFPSGSHLLFLGRSCNSLVRLLVGPIDNGHMICRFPDLHFSEAEKIFLNEILSFRQTESNALQRQIHDTDPNMRAIIKQCVNLCRVNGTGNSYNPRMLKSLASFLGISVLDPTNRKRWKTVLSKLEIDRNEAMQGMFESLQKSYNMLHPNEQDLFLDLALYTLAGKDDRKLHFEKQDAGVGDYLRNLTDACFWSKEDGVLGVHRDFARNLARKLDSLLFVQGSELDLGSLYSRMRAKREPLKKLAFVKCKFLIEDGCLDLSDAKCMGVLLLDNVDGLITVNLGLNNLCRLEVNTKSALQVTKINTSSLTLCTQLDARSWYNPISLLNPCLLVILELVGIDSTSWEVDATHLGVCGSLKFVQLDSIKLTNKKLDLSHWPRLVELKLSNLAEANMLSGLQNLQRLTKFSLATCHHLSALQLPGSLRHCYVEKCRRLSYIEIRMLPVKWLLDDQDWTDKNVFSVRNCEKLEELSGLCDLQHIDSFIMVGLSRLHKVKDVLDFSQGSGASDRGGIPCFISSMELTGDANIGSLCQLSVEQVSKRGFVQELVEKWLKDASGLKTLMVKCVNSGLCGCDAHPPNFGLMPHVQWKLDCPRACFQAPSSPMSFPEDESLASCFEQDVYCGASFLELENQEFISEATGDLRVIQRV